jgi:hypothetical protein
MWSQEQSRWIFLPGSNIGIKHKVTNDAILIISMILKHMISSAAEVEIGSVFLNAKEATILRTTLEEMGHPQPPTPLQSDNNTVMGYINDTIKQRRTRAMYMHFYWVKDRVKQGPFHVYWGPGYQNLANYFTKHNLPTHHKMMREMYIQASVQSMNRSGIRDSALRGCVNTQGTDGLSLTHLPRGIWYISPGETGNTAYNPLLLWGWF